MHHILVEIVLQSFKDMGATPDQLREERHRLNWEDRYLNSWMQVIDFPGKLAR